MSRRLVIVALLAVALSVSVLGCLDFGSSASSASSDPISGTWIKSQVNGESVSIPVSSVDRNTNVHFKVNTGNGEVAVMAYKLGDDIMVRSNVCPPCGSIGFTLRDDVLICDTCGTVFDAATGEGIQGACVSYPKESIPYTMSDGSIVMNLDDVVAAHQKTIEAY